MDTDPSKMRENIQTALDMLDKRDRLERTVLMTLRNSPNDYYNAFASISRNTRFIYIHAYQSYVWNRAVSERLRRFGKAVLIGDLVIKAGSPEEDLIEDDLDLAELNENEEERKEEADQVLQEEVKESAAGNIKDPNDPEEPAKNTGENFEGNQATDT